MATSRTVKTARPPNRSARMPAGSRHRAPLRIATAESHESWTSVSPNSSLIGTPRTPNISHAANISVNATVEIVRTRPAPGGTDVDASSGAGVAGVRRLAGDDSSPVIAGIPAPL